MTEPNRRHTRIFRFAVLAAIAVALLVGGIRLKSLADNPSAPTPVTTVHIKDFAYVPGTYTIKTGEMVTFINDDPVTHDVTSETKGQFASGDMNQGAKWSHTFTKAGTYKYLCTYHTYMKGTIEVKDAQ
jgi:plastocyanin